MNKLIFFKLFKKEVAEIKLKERRNTLEEAYRLIDMRYGELKKMRNKNRSDITIQHAFLTGNMSGLSDMKRRLEKRINALDIQIKQEAL